MTSYQTGGLFIFMVGMLIITASLPFVHLTARTNTVTAQIGDTMVRWLVRAFAIIVCLLGLVTYVQH